MSKKLLICLFALSLGMTNANADTWDVISSSILEQSQQAADVENGHAGEIKIAFILDDDVVANNPDAKATVESWVEMLNEFYERSGVEINAGIADIRVKNIGMTDGPRIINDMKNADGPFSDIRKYTDRKGADFTVTVIDGLTKGGDPLGGYAWVNGEYDSDWTYDKASDFLSYCDDHGWDECTSSGGWLSDRWEDFVDSVEEAAESIVDFTLGVAQDIADLVGIDDEEIPIPNLKQHKYFVSVVNFDNRALTLAHELGHNMGLIHGDHVINECGFVENYFDNRGYGIADYAGGFGTGDCDGIREPGEYGTIMVGNYGDGPVSPIFSHRAYSAQCGLSGGVCGDEKADAARALNENLARYNKQFTDVAELDYSDSNLKDCFQHNYLDQEVIFFNSMGCVGLGIKDISGINQLHSLKQIDLSDNDLINARELLDFNPDNMELINLQGNNHLLCYDFNKFIDRFGNAVLLPDQCFDPVPIIVSSLILN